jgi:molybdopterin-binding protein
MTGYRGWRYDQFVGGCESECLAHRFGFGRPSPNRPNEESHDDPPWTGLAVLPIQPWATNRQPATLPPVPTDERLSSAVDQFTVVAQVDMRCGPFTVVSLMSSEAVHELKLEPGSVAVAVIKATNVIVETPGEAS